MSDSDSDEESLLNETCFENGEMFRMAWQGSAQRFLKRDDYIPVRGTVMSEEESLEVRYDVDGLSIRWKDIGNGLALDYTHLTLAPRNALDIRPIFPLIKKHLNLHNYGSQNITNLRRAVGSQIMFESGWDTWLCFIPDPAMNHFVSAKMFQEIAVTGITQLRAEFRKQLFELLEKGMAIDTLAKNNLYDIRKMFVLPGDRRIILGALQTALERTHLVGSGIRKTLYTFRFGEKNTAPVKLPILDNESVEDICVHVGISLRSEFFDLLWSREGVNSVIGRRGTITSALSFFECVNFQSNLDGNAIDVKPKLMQICRYPENVRFVQLYVDAPHRRPRTLVHPVSGSVLFVNGIYREASKAKLYREAIEYLSEIRNNCNQLRRGVCRMEYVVLLPSISCTVSASSLVLEEKISSLLKEEAMLAPFSSDDNVMGIIRDIGLHVCEELTRIYDTRRGTGDSDSVWEAFQYELAIERLLWGNPFCGASFQYSVNLGVGMGFPTRCLTDQMGFLCLENSSACCLDEETTPPLQVYTKNVTVQRQIQKLFGLINYAEASSQVLGRRIMLCLLMDLHETGHVYAQFGEFLLTLKRSSGSASKRIVGGITVNDAAAKLVRVKKVKWPMVFGIVKKLLGFDEERLQHVIVEGINALELGYFPACRYYDESRSEGLNWQFKNGLLVIIEDNNQVTNYESEAASLHYTVLSELEKRKICHTAQYERNVFPWLKPCLQKLCEKKLNRDEKVAVLAFLTGVALLMNGMYVEYLNLSRLERNLPVTQTTLRMLEIQCKFQVSGVNTFKLFKLHPSIPYKLYSKKSIERLTPPKKEQKEEPEPVRDVDEIGSMATTTAEECSAINTDPMEIVASRHVANRANEKRAVWTAAEVAILHDAIEKGVDRTKGMYKLYQENCRKKGIPDRTLKAFTHKMTRELHSRKKMN